MKTGLNILRISEVILNLKNLPFKQMQYSNWNIAYAYDQLGKNTTNSGSKGYGIIV